MTAEKISPYRWQYNRESGSVLSSMILHLMTSRFQGAVSYWYGAKDVADVYYSEDFDALADAFGNFNWHIALSEPGVEESWNGHHGFVHEAVLANYLSGHDNPAACEYYLCGPPPMLKACLEMLAELGVPECQIAFDDFGN